MQMKLIPQVVRASCSTPVVRAWRRRALRADTHLNRAPPSLDNTFAGVVMVWLMGLAFAFSSHHGVPLAPRFSASMAFTSVDTQGFITRGHNQQWWDGTHERAAIIYPAFDNQKDVWSFRDGKKWTVYAGNICDLSETKSAYSLSSPLGWAANASYAGNTVLYGQTCEVWALNYVNASAGNTHVVKQVWVNRTASDVGVVLRIQSNYSRLVVWPNYWERWSEVIDVSDFASGADATPDTAFALPNACPQPPLPATSQPSATPVDAHARWESWRIAYGKQYESTTEFERARAVWLSNDAVITAHNAKGKSYTLAHNEFSDLTSETFRVERFPGLLPATDDTTAGTPHRMFEGLHGPLPAAVDWEAVGAVTPVKNQGVRIRGDGEIAAELNSPAHASCQLRRNRPSPCRHATMHTHAR